MSRVIVEYQKVVDKNGDFWILVSINGETHDLVGPFQTEDEYEIAYNDFLETMRSFGAVDGGSA